MLGDLDGITRLREQTSTDFNVGDYDLRTPLHIAACTGTFQIVKFLIEKCNVDVNPIDRWGATPLSDATMLGFSEIV